MSQTILLTGATDGIGLETAKILVSQGHIVLLHGRSREKLNALAETLSTIGKVETYLADMSKLEDVALMADAIIDQHSSLDVVINNAGVFKTSQTRTDDGFDTRFMVNTIAPYLLTQKLLPILAERGRVINLSSAAQASVDIKALLGQHVLGDMEAYAQSKLAITMWTRHLAKTHDDRALVFLAVNPGSLLASKMVKEGFGVAGKDLGIGADILVRAALSDEFTYASGQYFDNDSGRISPPQADGLDDEKMLAIVEAIEKIIT